MLIYSLALTCTSVAGAQEISPLSIANDTTISVNLRAGWNMVSVPVEVSDQNVLMNFGVPYLFGYEGGEGYFIADTIQRGRGYWMKASSPETLSFVGRLRLRDTVDVKPGWNLVGSLSQSFLPQDGTTLHVIPTGRVSSLFVFPCFGGWICELQPGLAFWAKIASDSPNPRLVMTSVLFSDDFNRGNLNGWTFKTGAWNFVDSLVQTDEESGHHFLMLPDHDFRNLELVADVMKTSDDTDPEHPAVVFRWTSDTMNYVFRINGVGAQSWIQLMRDMDNGDRNAKYIQTEPWLTSDTDHRMDKDVWYTMKVNANDDHIQCKVWKKSDEEPPGWIIDLRDSTYSHGLIGLEYYTGRHRFDNVIVRASD